MGEVNPFSKDAAEATGGAYPLFEGMRCAGEGGSINGHVEQSPEPLLSKDGTGARGTRLAYAVNRKPQRCSLHL
jgi:hypothetical protein